MNPARLANVAGVVTLGIGIGLTFAPKRTAAALGSDRDGVGYARAVGITDLVIGTALLRPNPTWPWMAARTTLNLLVAARYYQESRLAADPSRSRAAVLRMLIATAYDGPVMVALGRVAARG